MVAKYINADHSRFQLHILFKFEDIALARWFAVKVFPGALTWSLQ
jgi:hypothetical protein